MTTAMAPSPELAAVVASRLKVLREGDNLSQRDLAEACGVTLSVLNRAILGSSTPAPDALLKIANHYSVSLDWLLGRVDGRPKRMRPKVMA